MATVAIINNNLCAQQLKRNSPSQINNFVKVNIYVYDGVEYIVFTHEKGGVAVIRAIQ